MRLLKIAKILPFILFLFVSSGEAKSNSQSDDILKQMNDNQLHTIVLTSDNHHRDSDYYYALFMIKDRYPDKNYDVHIYDNKSQPGLAKTFNIKSYPALILISNSKQVVTIEGNKNWDNIFDKLINYFH